MSDSLRPHELQHARPPCPSPTPGVHSDPRGAFLLRPHMVVEKEGEGAFLDFTYKSLIPFVRAVMHNLITYQRPHPLVS